MKPVCTRCGGREEVGGGGGAGRIGEGVPNRWRRGGGGLRGLALGRLGGVGKGFCAISKHWFTQEVPSEVLLFPISSS